MATGNDIIKAGKAKTRNSSSLYPAYIEMFKQAFGYEPACPTCGSAQGNRDWEAFRNYITKNVIETTKKTEIMATQNSFVLRDKNKIYSLDYKHKNGRILRKRVYGYAMDEAWAKEYLENADGLADEKKMQERFAEFKTLPESFIEAESTSDFESLTKDELKAKLAELEVEEKTYKNLKHPELVALLEATILEKENNVDGADGAADGADVDSILD